MYERKTITNERGIPIHDALVLLPTLRDQLAMAALTGLLAYSDADATPETFSQLAYEYADAMMEARK